MSLIQFNQVSLAYGEQTVLQDIGFSIASGEFVGLLGPNGCGKTTLLKLMAGVLKPEQGSIELQGKKLPDYTRKDLAKRIAVLPQDTMLDFPFTALEVVLMGRAPYLGTFQWETKKDLQIAQEAMEQTDCAQFAKRDIRELSGGERERVLLARALAQQPEILLLDEPTTHLDLKHQVEIFQLLQRLNQKLTLIVVLHDLNFAAQACHRVLLLGEQKLQADGPPETVLTPERIQQVFGVGVHALPVADSKRPWLYPHLS